MVSCWICNGYCHLKCSEGLKAHDADGLLDKSKFLQWTCCNCRKVRVEFYSLFQNSRNEFENICRDFTLLNEKLLKYGELFSKFSCLDNFVNSTPSSSPKRKKIRENHIISQIPNQKFNLSIEITDTVLSKPPTTLNLYQAEHISETPVQTLAPPLISQQRTISPIPTIISIPETQISMTVGQPSTSNLIIDPKEPGIIRTIPLEKLFLLQDSL